jgi:hypothetical protein
MVFALSIRVGLISIVCLGAGGALAALTWWFWKTAMPEPAALARLEIMSDRRYEEASPRERELLLAEANEVMPVSVRNTKATAAPRQPMTVRQPQKPVRVREPQVQQISQEPRTRKPIDPLLK